MYARLFSRCYTRSPLTGIVAKRGFSTVLRRSTVAAAAAPSLSLTFGGAQATLCAGGRLEHTTPASEISKDDISTQLNDLMDSFAEARELIKDAMESVGTTYFGDDMEDAEVQTKDVLKKWADVQAFLEASGQKEELQKLRNMHDLKIKQMEAELESVRDAGGSG